MAPAPRRAASTAGSAAPTQSIASMRWDLEAQPEASLELRRNAPGQSEARRGEPRWQLTGFLKSEAQEHQDPLAVAQEPAPPLHAASPSPPPSKTNLPLPTTCPSPAHYYCVPRPLLQMASQAPALAVCDDTSTLNSPKAPTWACGLGLLRSSGVGREQPHGLHWPQPT